MTFLEQFAIIVGIASTAVTAIAWYIKTQLKDVKRDICDLKEEVAYVAAETKTNGGSSMRDEIKHIKTRQDEADIIRRETNEKIDKMYLILIDYIAGQNSKKRSKSKSDI